jgi:molybdopterin molybdotransferase
MTPAPLRSIDEALALVLDGIEPLDAESAPIAAAAGRILAADARAAVDLPPFDRSAMDGFAVRAADTAPGVGLRIVGDVAAGTLPDAALEPGTAAPISTGAAIPEGADAVLQSEHAAVDGATVTPDRNVPVGMHLRHRGEDLRAGDVLARAGQRLTLPLISALASAGAGTLDVHRQPSLRMMVTGSELLPVGAPPEPGRIHESNGLMVALLAERAGALAGETVGIPDDRAATEAAIRAGLDADVLVVSGGVSVGPHDHVRPAFEACGVEEVFWRVSIKPGKPLWFGRRGRTLVFGLPGNPLSAIVGTCMFIVPALRRLAGERDAMPGLVPGRLAVSAEASDGRTTFLTSRLAPGADGVLEATPTERQGSHMTGALGESDGFAIVPDGPALPAGTAVDLLVLG